MSDAPTDTERVLRPSTEALLRDVATWDLTGEWGEPVEPGPAEAAALVAAARRMRLTGPLLQAVDRQLVTLPASARTELSHHHRAALLWCLHLERRLLAVRSAFDAAGDLRYLVVKGPAIAHLDRQDPGSRTFADLDLLVDAAAMDRATAVIASLGAVRPWAERRPGFDRRFAKSVTMRDADGVEVDLHRSLCDGLHGFRIPLHELFARPDHFELGGGMVPTLQVEHRLLHAAYHAVLGSPAPRLFNLRDLAGYLTDPRVDVDLVAATVRRWRGEAVLAVAIDAARGALVFDAGPWERWRRAVVVAEGDRAIIDRQRRDGSSFGRAKLEAVGELPTWSLRAAYVRACVWPDAAHLRSRGLRRRDLIGRAGFRRG